jgi:hypothetical protein
MEATKNRINIMTSCDDNYARLVPVQLLSIADNLPPPIIMRFIFIFSTAA